MATLLLSELLIKLLLALLPVALQLAYVSASLYYANSSKCKLPTDECVLIFFRTMMRTMSGPHTRKLYHPVEFLKASPDCNLHLSQIIVGH